jgi:hypothetical protein
VYYYNVYYASLSADMHAEVLYAEAADGRLLYTPLLNWRRDEVTAGPLQPNFPAVQDFVYRYTESIM